MVRIKDGNYIAIFHDRMIEVKASEKHEAYEKAKRYFESREHRELIGKTLVEMSERNERVMKNFFYRIGYKGIIGYENDLRKKVFTIWTDKPGILIGKGGQNVCILKDILKEEFDYDYEIEFKEIKGKMLVIV